MNLDTGFARIFTSDAEPYNFKNSKAVKSIKIIGNLLKKYFLRCTIFSEFVGHSLLKNYSSFEKPLKITI